MRRLEVKALVSGRVPGLTPPEGSVVRYPIDGPRHDLDSSRRMLPQGGAQVLDGSAFAPILQGGARFRGIPANQEASNDVENGRQDH